MRRPKIFGAVLAAAATVLIVASTAYACVNIKGTATVTGSVRSSNVMTGSGAHGYCAGGDPVTAAAGPASSSASASFAASTGSCASKLPTGTYDVKLRNITAGYAGADGAIWKLTEGTGCFSGLPGGTISSLGTMSIGTSGSGSVNWTVPAGALPNGPTDASVFCVKDQASFDGFLAPFRVSTI